MVIDMRASGRIIRDGAGTYIDTNDYRMNDEKYDFFLLSIQFNVSSS